MVDGVEFLTAHRGARTARAWLLPCADGVWAAGMRPKVTHDYAGEHPWLSVYGVGAPANAAAVRAHVASGRRAACWDMGYVGKSRDLTETHVRVSIDGMHLQPEHLDRTPPDPSRWQRLGIALSEEAREDGHIVVIGMGAKSHAAFPELAGWEERALQDAARRFPRNRVVYRPKPSSRELDTVVWPDRIEGVPFAPVLRGARLVICRHSNAAVQACVAGVPVECEMGAAHWLYSKHPRPTQAQRLDFLHRVAWWQWRLTVKDMEQAWKFLLTVSS